MISVNNMNQVTAIGTLYKTGRGLRGYPEISLVIGRKSMSKAFVKFVLETTLDPSIQVQTTVKVQGFVRGYQTRNEKGKWIIDQYFVATKVERAAGEMETIFGVQDHFKPRNDFKCYIKGRINSVLQTSKDWKSLIISIPGSREIPEIINATIRNNVRYREFDALQKGDEFVAKMDVWTPQKEIKGEIKNFEDLVIEDIFITNRDITKEQKAEESQKVPNNQDIPAEPMENNSTSNNFTETEE